MSKLDSEMRLWFLTPESEGGFGITYDGFPDVGKVIAKVSSLIDRRASGDEPTPNEWFEVKNEAMRIAATTEFDVGIKNHPATWAAIIAASAALPLSHRGAKILMEAAAKSVASSIGEDAAWAKIRAKTLEIAKDDKQT